MPVFFGIVLGGWILKFVVFIVVLLVLRGQPWVDPDVFFVAVVVSVLASLVVDVVVLLRMRVPHVSDVDAARPTPMPATRDGLTIGAGDAQCGLRSLREFGRVDLAPARSLMASACGVTLTDHRRNGSSPVPRSWSQRCLLKLRP